MEKGKATKVISLLLVPACIIQVLAFPVASHHPGGLLVQFMHANILHAALNLWALLSVCFFWVVPFPTAVIGWAVAQIFFPSGCCGLSGLIYFLYGSGTFQLARSRQFFFVCLATILVGIIIPHIAWQVHLWCYLSGCAYSLGRRFLCRR